MEAPDGRWVVAAQRLGLGESLYFGGVHAVHRSGKSLEAEGDQRRGGEALRVE